MQHVLSNGRSKGHVGGEKSEGDPCELNKKIRKRDICLRPADAICPQAFSSKLGRNCSRLSVD